MAIRSVPGTDLEYYLISYDKKGRERTDDPDAPGGRLSEVVLGKLVDEPVTDVFFVSHGWKGDVPAAIDQYDRWIGAMALCDEDRRRVREVRPDWRSLIVGLHWPSRPWGDEEQAPAGAVSFGAPGEDPIAPLVEDAADKIADSDRARAALRTIFASAMEEIAPPHLPDEVRQAFDVLVEEAELVAAGPAGAPGDDAEGFDPERAYQSGLEEEAAVAFGDGVLGGVFGVLRQLSYWKMKKRARLFGESGAATLLREMQRRVPAGRDVRFHLMGHSFGCIVISATVAGAAGEALARPVDSVYLVQGALSYWAYCSDIPVAPGTAGYFHPMVRDRKVAGPLVTTQSEHDSAVGRLFPLASQIKGSVAFDPADPPKYGALGAFGVRGPGVAIVDLEMKPLDAGYGFEPGKVYNLEGSEVINQGGGLSGAHSDIAKPEVAHAFWQAILTAVS